MCNKQDHNDIFFLESDGTAFSYGIKYGIIRSTYSKSSSQSSVSVEWVPTQTTVLVHTHTKKNEQNTLRLGEGEEALHVVTRLGGAEGFYRCPSLARRQKANVTGLQEQFGYKINMEIYMVASGD